MLCVCCVCGAFAGAALQPQPPFHKKKPKQINKGDRLEEDWAPADDARPAEEVEREARRGEAAAHAVVLEMIGDLPDADAAPPADVLFVAKLNPVTTEEDLEIIFGR